MKGIMRMAGVALAVTLAGCGGDKVTEETVKEFLQQGAEAADAFDHKASCEQYAADADIEITAPDENGVPQTSSLSRNEACMLMAMSVAMYKRMDAESHSLLSLSSVQVADDGKSADFEGAFSQRLKVEGEEETMHTSFSGTVSLREDKLLITSWYGKQI